MLDADRATSNAILVSILVPLYNEEELVGESLRRVISAPLPPGVELEIVVVDDGSKDNSVVVVRELQERHPGLIRLIQHEKNSGKGAAIRTAIEHSRGEFSIIQDADLEYSPREFTKLLAPLLAGEANAVFGSRFLVTGQRRVLYFWHSVANSMLTMLSNMFSNLNLTDMETCYKAVRTSLLKSIPLRSDRFGLEPELTIKLGQREVSVYEISIDYHGRTYEEGKKIGLKDAFQALFVILEFGLFRRDIYRDSVLGMLDIRSRAPRFNRWLASVIEPWLGPTVLDLGAGNGDVTVHLCRRRKRYIAADFDPEHFSRLRVRLQFRRQMEIAFLDPENAEAFAPYCNALDSVVCLNVLERVGDDAAVLRNIYSSLKPGGRAVLVVPEGPSLYGSLDETLGRRRRYAEPVLRALLVTCGFDVQRVVRFNRISRPAWFWNGRVRKKRSFSRFQVATFDRLVGIWKLFDRVLPWNGNSLVVVVSRSAALRESEPA